MKRLSHVHKHTLHLDLRRLKCEGDWTSSHVPTSGFVPTTMVEEKDTVSCANHSMENQGRTLTVCTLWIWVAWDWKIYTLPFGLLRVDKISYVAQKTKIHSNMHLTLEFSAPLKCNEWRISQKPSLFLLLTTKLLTSKFIVKGILNRNIAVYIFTREKNVREMCHDRCLPYVWHALLDRSALLP